MSDALDRDVPEGTHRFTTGCQYCAVGCGYNAILVPLEDTIETPGNDTACEGTHTTTCDGPTKKLKVVSRYITPAMRNTIRYAGKEYRAAVVPDARCDLNKGNHSIRGGSQGHNLVTSDGSGRSTKDRLKSPQVRLADCELHEIDWDTANRIMAALTVAATSMRIDEKNSRRIEVQRPGGLGVKLYEYQFLENTFAATKLFYSAIGTPNLAYHDRPSAAGSSPALEDAGMRPHDFAYDDLRHSDVLFFIGTNPYENQSVAFMQYCAGKEMIVMDPRETATAQYANRTGGLHLPAVKDQTAVAGVDSLVVYALCHEILTRYPEICAEWSDHRYQDREIDVDGYGQDWALATDSHIAEMAKLDPKKVRPCSKQEQQQKRRASRSASLKAFKEFLGIGLGTLWRSRRRNQEYHWRICETLSIAC